MDNIKKVNIDNKYNCYFGYDILDNDDIKNELNSILDKANKILIVKDNNISDEVLKKIGSLFKGYSIYIYNFFACEENKSIDEYYKIQSMLLGNNFSRSDCIVSFGGGVTSDLVGFVASTYKRGIKSIYFPTSTLSMIDASIGGKCAINLDGVKNAIGSFYNPSIVIMELNILKTLPRRHMNNGFVEAIKMGLTIKPELYNCFKALDNLDIEKIIELSILSKKEIVEIDYLDKGEREILNFGHTIAHAIELSDNKYLHGECVAFGIINRILDLQLKEEVKKIFLEMGIDVDTMSKEFDINNLDFANDKKVSCEKIRESFLVKLGEYEFREIELK